MSKPIVYISGPMSGYVNYNRDAFYAAEQRLIAYGFRTINPAALDKADGSDTDIKPHAWYMRRDVAALLEADFIYLLPGWRWSRGASLEANVAKGCGIGVLTDLEPHIWRTFEGEPENQAEALRYEVTDLGREALAAVDLPVKHVPGGTPSPSGDEDLADHPRFGPAFEEFGMAAAARHMSERLFADISYTVDDTLPEHTLRIVTPAGHLDFEVVEDPEHGIRLERHDVRHGVEDYDLAEATKPAEGDEFPNVGYVRRFKALLGLDRSINEGARRSA